MKLIIDIPEDMFEWFKNEGIIDDYDNSALKQILKNGTPLSEVLVKIKKEMEEHQLSKEYCCLHNIDTAIDMGMVRIILDKHICGGDKE